ncbi:MAG TPA: hypothetical protein VM537_30970 [Anaerolineae bacterium]|nr:hypothetical protein [Anaerolineae bacterium]
MPAPLTDEWIEEQLIICKQELDAREHISPHPWDYPVMRLYHAAHEGYPLTLQLLKETRALLRNVLLELDHMVSHNPECLCDEDCQEEARELLNRHEGLEAADASTE